MKSAVILFPGTNCEKETKHVMDYVGLKADIVRWNEPEDKLGKYSSYVLPGGWSYEDRVRAGVIAAKGRIMEFLKQADREGKPILGICNGCQILIEAGLVPGLGIERVEMALAPNINPKVSGYYCTWVRLKKEHDCAFTRKIRQHEIIQMPIAHGEGRFVTQNREVLEGLKKNRQIVFLYCDERGQAIDQFPVNPNSSVMNIAGVCNRRGNVLAIMPHPERASFRRQLRLNPMESFEQAETKAPAIKIFESMKTYLGDEDGQI